MVEPRRPVGLPPLVERPEVPTRVPPTAASWLMQTVLRPVWLWRRELALVLPALVGVAAGAGWLAWGGAVWALLAVGAGGVYGVVLPLLGVARVRRGVRVWLWRGRVRRGWDGACRFAGLESVSLRVPRIRRIERFAAGERLRVRLTKGCSAEELEKAAEKLAVVLDVREVRVRRDPSSARYPWVEVLRSDPFRDASGPLVVASPLARAESWSLWDALPCGLSTLGAVTTVSLPGRNLLIGGEPEAGKSVAQAQILAAATLDPTTRMFGLDAKQVELALWEPVMDRVVYNDIDAAVSLLADLIAVMDDRYARLVEWGRRLVQASMGWALYVLAIDELRFFTYHPNKTRRVEFNTLLIDVVARGRAAGIIVVAATQRPSSDVVPTSLRDLFAYRWALRCSTRDASDTILGGGWAAEGYSAATIDPGERGVGLLLAEGGIPVQVKSGFLSDEEIGAIVARGLTLRGRL